MQKLKFWGLLGLLGAAGAIGGWWFGPDFSDPAYQSGYRTQVTWAPIAETVVIFGLVTTLFLKDVATIIREESKKVCVTKEKR